MDPRIRRLTTTGLLILSAALLTACSGSDASYPIISAEEFTEKGNALCKANGEAVASGFMAMSQPPTEEQKKAAFDNLVAESYKFSDDLAALGAPEDKQGVLKQVIETGDRITGEVEDAGMDEFFATEGAAYDELEPRLKELGLDACLLPQE